MAKEQIQRYGRLRNHLFFTDIFFPEYPVGTGKVGMCSGEGQKNVL